MAQQREFAQEPGFHLQWVKYERTLNSGKQKMKRTMKRNRELRAFLADWGERVFVLRFLRSSLLTLKIRFQACPFTRTHSSIAQETSWHTKPLQKLVSLHSTSGQQEEHPSSLKSPFALAYFNYLNAHVSRKLEETLSWPMDTLLLQSEN